MDVAFGSKLQAAKRVRFYGVRLEKKKKKEKKNKRGKKIKKIKK
jgi:hypothetical protein